MRTAASVSAPAASAGLNKSVTVRVPATVANIGPGFDCLGMAINIYNTVTVTPGDSFGMTFSGEGERVLSRGRDNLMYRAMERLFHAVKQPVPDFSILCRNGIPLSRGLGSSAAAVAAGLVAANSVLGDPLPGERLLELGAGMEGHADNLAPALFGGCQVVTRDGARLVHERIPMRRGWRFVLFIPDFEIETPRAREILPRQVPRDDAVFNLGRVALLTKALITGQTETLHLATQDRLHQPHREALYPAMSAVFAAALSAGADGVFLAGSGSTILALARDRFDEIGNAMLTAGGRRDIRGVIRVAGLSHDGVRVLQTGGAARRRRAV